MWLTKKLLELRNRLTRSRLLQHVLKLPLFLSFSLLPDIANTMVEFAESKRGDRETALSSSSAVSLSDVDDSPHEGSRQTTDRDERRAHKKKKRRRAKECAVSEVNGGSESRKRKNSLSKAARDPRDEPERRKKKKAKAEGTETRSPSPVIDFDGLSRPSLSSLALLTQQCASTRSTN